MKHTIAGACHCTNLAFELSTRVAPSAIQARCCDCSFCRIHCATTWSDPAGSATIRVIDEQLVNRYRFGLKSADFLICRVCGAYVGAVLTDDEGTWSTLNLRLSDLEPSETRMHYGSEDALERTRRRKRLWTPTTIVAGT